MRVAPPEVDERLNELIVGLLEHSVAFVFDVGDEVAHLLQGLGDALLVFRLRRSDAVELELFQLVGKRSLSF